MDVGHPAAAEDAEEEGARDNCAAEVVEGPAGFGLGVEAAWWVGFARVRMVVLQVVFSLLRRGGRRGDRPSATRGWGAAGKR